MQQEKMALQCCGAVFSCCEMSSACFMVMFSITVRDSPLAERFIPAQRVIRFHFAQAGLLIVRLYIFPDAIIPKHLISIDQLSINFYSTLMA